MSATNTQPVIYDLRAESFLLKCKEKLEEISLEDKGEIFEKLVLNQSLDHDSRKAIMEMADQICEYMEKRDRENPYIPRAIGLNDIHNSEKADSELIKHRFLCKQGGLLLVGETGKGKSSISMQFSINFSLGRKWLGFEPARPLKILVVQAENDNGDMEEMRKGIYEGMNLSEAEIELVGKNIIVHRESRYTKNEFFDRTVEPLLKVHKPDLLVLDPIFSFIGDDASKQKVVSTFLRNLLNPLLEKYNCGVIIVHHCNKPVTDPNRLTLDPAYMGAGSAEWANWARAVVSLTEEDSGKRLFRITAGKRGSRLNWKNGEERVNHRYVSQTPKENSIYWIETSHELAKEILEAKSSVDLMQFVPENYMIGKRELESKLTTKGISGRKATLIVQNAITCKELHEIQMPRKDNKAKSLLSRSKVTVPKNIMFNEDDLNSRGLYFIPEGWRCVQT